MSSFLLGYKKILNSVLYIFFFLFIQTDEILVSRYLWVSRLVDLCIKFSYSTYSICDGGGDAAGQPQDDFPKDERIALRKRKTRNYTCHNVGFTETDADRYFRKTDTMLFSKYRPNTGSATCRPQ